MNRRLLVSLMALGAVITLVGAAGIFAVFTDRARTGNSSVTSGERGSAADLLIAPSLLGPPECGTFVDDLVTDLFSINDAQPAGGFLGQAFICLKNAGSASLALSAATIDLVDVETACTGDEAAVGDASCGIVGGVAGAGELAPMLLADIRQVNCTTGAPGGGGLIESLADLQSGVPLGIFPAPDEVVCLRLEIFYSAATSDTAIQIAQTDKVTWRFAFDGTTS